MCYTVCMDNTYHTSVMPREAIAGLAIQADGVYVDCTLGGGGHSAAIAARLSARGRLIGIDRDADALAAARERLAAAACGVRLVHDNFAHLDAILADAPPVDGVLLDLGVSSHQIDTASRGFSYLAEDAPLDMRMDAGQPLTAADIINGYSAQRLADIFREYGEERWATRIAQFVVNERPLRTTGDLVAAICRAVPKAVRRQASGHPAKRVFQALRIAVNDELSVIAPTLRAAVRHLRVGGRLVVIAFHSLEDRAVKTTLRELARGCVCPPELPVCVCHHTPEVRLLGKGARPTAAELAANPRAHSATLRVAVRL